MILIGLCSTQLRVDALKAAVREAKAGRDLRQYETAVRALHESAPVEVEATPDTDWADRIKRQNQIETAKLDGELRGYKNNLIKESIRVWYGSKS